MTEVDSIAKVLEAGEDDAVALGGPHGGPPLCSPGMAAAFVSIAAGAPTAPLNPGYRAEEFEFYLTDLKAKALVLEAGSDSPARAVAQKLGVPLIELSPQRDQGA